MKYLITIIKTKKTCDSLIELVNQYRSAKKKDIKEKIEEKIHKALLKILSKSATKIMKKFLTITSIDVSFFLDRKLLKHNIKLLEEYKNEGSGVVFAKCTYLKNSSVALTLQGSEWYYIDSWDGKRTHNITKTSFYIIRIYVGEKTMNILKLKIISIVIILFRTILLFFDFYNLSFSWSVYVVNFNQIGDYYLTSIASLIYILSPVFLLISLFWHKKQNQLILCSISELLFASAIELVAYFILQKNNVYVPSLMINSSCLFVSTLCVIIGFASVVKSDKNINTLKTTCLLAVIIYLICVVNTILNRDSLNITFSMSVLLNILNVYLISQGRTSGTGDGSVS